MKQIKRRKVIRIFGIASRILNREDNLYKQEVIKDILQMYLEECDKALVDGYGVGLDKVGTLIPQVHSPKSYYPINSMNLEEGNKPYTTVKFNRSKILKSKMDKKYRKNVKDGIPGLGEECMCNTSQRNRLIEKGFLVMNGTEIEDYDEDFDEDKYIDDLDDDYEE